MFSNFRSLPEAMSIEIIAASKTKYLTKKWTAIKGNADTGLGSNLHVMLDSDVDVTKDIISKECQWRTHTTIPQSAGKVHMIILIYIGTYIMKSKSLICVLNIC
jgi:parafibromin